MKISFIGLALVLQFYAASLAAQKTTNSKVANQANTQTLMTVESSDASFQHLLSLALYIKDFQENYPDQVCLGSQSKPGKYLFDLSGIEQPFYISLLRYNEITKVNDCILQQYFVEPGDSVNIKVFKDSSFSIKSYPSWSSYQPYYRFQFSGRNAAKYNCRYEMDLAVDTISDSWDCLSNEGEFLPNNRYDKIIAVSNKLVKKYRATLSSRARELLKADFVARSEVERIKSFYYSQAEFFNDTVKRQKLIKKYDQIINQEEKDLELEAMAFSVKYWEFVVQKWIFEAKLLKDVSTTYEKIKRTYSGKLLEKTTTGFAINSLNKPFYSQYVMDDIKSHLSDEFYQQKVEGFMNRNAKGKAAYNFSLFDTAGKTVTLNNFKGKVVFIDFWFTSCYGCSQFYTSVLKEIEEEYKKNEDIVFVSISIDLDRNKWIKSIDKNLYTSFDAINLYTKGRGEDNDVIKYYEVNSYPKMLLIDRNGKIFSSNSIQLRKKESLKELIEQALKGS